MRIDPDRCVACGNCIPVCPMGAITVDTFRQRAVVDADACVECYTCFRGMSMERLSPLLVRGLRRVFRAFRLRFDPEPDVCPTSAIQPEPLEWPRVVRRAFSDPQVPHESTGIHGRGTEEVKTNDVTGRVRVGEVGYVIEFGRPNVGVRFRDIEAMTTALAALGVEFEANNPVTHLMTDRAAGTIRGDIHAEKVLSAIVEFKTAESRMTEILDCVDRVASGLDTVVAVGVSTRCDAEGRSSIEETLTRSGHPWIRGKTNLGLGAVSAS